MSITGMHHYIAAILGVSSYDSIKNDKEIKD